jgi:hypothetical protein
MKKRGRRRKREMIDRTRRQVNISSSSVSLFIVKNHNEDS